MERIITKSFARLMGRGIHRGFITHEELNKSLGKRNLSSENLAQAFIHILEKNYNDDEKILEMLNEILRDIKNYELEFRIAELESKFSKDLSEATFNELKELKKQQKIN